MERGAWRATVHGGCKELDTTEQITYTQHVSLSYTYTCLSLYMYVYIYIYIYIYVTLQNTVCFIILIFSTNLYNFYTNSPVKESSKLF